MRVSAVDVQEDGHVIVAGGRAQPIDPGLQPRFWGLGHDKFPGVWWGKKFRSGRAEFVVVKMKPFTSAK